MILTNLSVVFIFTQVSWEVSGTLPLLQKTQEFSPPFNKATSFEPDPRLLFTRITLALLFSGLVSAWLAWYVTKPVRQLREASHRLANGELEVRVAHKMDTRKDEIADLGKDFDYMAKRLQMIINNQKQLLQDVSHELRSPLARLQVGMGLALKKLGSEADSELLRIEKEVKRLDELISQILTVVKLDDLAYPLEEYIDIKAMLN